MRRVAAVAALVFGALVTAPGAAPAGDTGEPSPGCGAAPTPGVSIETIAFGGASREYHLAVPAGVGARETLGLVLNFHGFGSNADQQAVYSELEEKGPERGYVVVTPQGTGDPAFWNIIGLEAPDDAAYTEVLIDAAAARLCVDPRRVYATGMSNGGGMSSYLGCQVGDRFAAVAPVAGVNLAFDECPNGKGVSVIAFHGEGDAVVPYEGGAIGIGVLPDRQLPSVEEAVASWGERAGCRERARTENVSEHVVLTDYSRCRRGTDVQLYSVTDGGHTWPGAIDVPRLGAVTTEIDAADLILDFFDEHRRPRRR
ncbi:MAG TPA: PHB depolymerase family esterase [Acidimicrobiia bacterium]